MEDTITILLIGETGVGKSTFINAFVNYLSFNTLKEAVKDVKCLIPTQFAMFDKKNNRVKISYGEPDLENEGTDSTQSCTKHCKCYTFKFESFTLKFIDTPGIGDTNGVNMDNINMRNMLSFISQFKEINAICVLLKPNTARVSAVFKYCILQILAHLDKSAANNLIFVFTNARGSDYRPGDTAQALDKVLEAVKSRPPNVEIKFDENTTYSLENESFRYLVSVSEPNNLEFDEKFVKLYEESWINSMAECERMLSYIRSLEPHLVQDTITINNIREKIILLQKPIGDIAQNISQEIRKCENQRKRIREFVGEIEELNKELYIPTFYTHSTPLEEPMTVCIDPKCREEKVMNGEKTFHYKSICHRPCYLKHSDGNIIGDTGLLDCKAFNRYVGEGGFWDSVVEAFAMPDHKTGLHSIGKIFGEYSNRRKSEECYECGHSFRIHMYLTYNTKIIIQKVRDEDKHKLITTKEELVKSKEETISKLEDRIKELKNESEIIANISAELVCFLKKNALAPFNDSLEEYVKYLIDNQKSELFEEEDSDQRINTLQTMLEQYQKMKEILLEAIDKEDSGSDRISSEKINERFTQLFGLKNYGNVIERIFEMQKLTEASIHTTKERVFDMKPGMGSNLSVFVSTFKSFGKSLMKKLF